jgi:hypothetical protein
MLGVEDGESRDQPLQLEFQPHAYNSGNLSTLFLL